MRSPHVNCVPLYCLSNRSISRANVRRSIGIPVEGGSTWLTAIM